MGLNINGVKLLLHARQLEVDFEKVLTIGRQMLYLRDKEMDRLLDQAGIPQKDRPGGRTNGSYAEPFLKMLGAGTTDSLDASAYEEATLIHDLNLPLPEKMHSRYSLVIDGGSLEHVFNFPAAIRNCMNLVQVGGHYLGITPANNFLGHGFYQFSPELYYRIFTEANGFEMIKMYLFADRKKTTFYEVLDPLVLKHRVIMANASPSYLFVLAQKTSEKEVFETVPQQSDYEHIVWNRDASVTAGDQRKQKISRLVKVKRILADGYLRRVRAMGNSNPQYIRKTELDLTGNRK